MAGGAGPVRERPSGSATASGRPGRFGRRGLHCPCGGRAQLHRSAPVALPAELSEAKARSQALEAAIDRYHPESRVVDGRTAGIAQELEDRIAAVDRELQMTDLADPGRRETQELELWRERVGLLDALVDVHLTRASNVGL